jgi:TolA-binding protein
MKSLSVLFFISFLILTGCSTKNDVDFWKEAEEKLSQNQIPEAVAAFEKIVSDFPKSEKAPAALFHIGSLYQNLMIINVNESSSYEKSITVYRQLYEKYPASEKAPMALFMTGYIQANELRRYNEATATYNLFLEKYPQHELSASAKEELEYMGLSPEEILKTKVEKSI